MKIFPLRPLSAIDRVKNFYNIVTKAPLKTKNIEQDVVTLSNKPLVKGRCICDMLSE